MTQQEKTTWKLIYLSILLALLVPLWWLGAPRTVGGTEGALVENPGGVLARELARAELSIANLGRIDPTSSAMKLGTFGMRGVAIALLWHEAQEFKKRKDWNNFIATGEQITRLEPHFTSVWEFLGWELAYNASAEFDDYRERYRWVIHGFDWLVRGTEVNEISPILRHKAGWTISQRIGIADERIQYRRLLREDEAFHTRYNTPSIADRDNWLIGRRWYLEAERQYELNNYTGIRNIAPPLFYSHSRQNLIHYADWLSRDGMFENNGQRIRDAWAHAAREWHDYGQMRFNTTIPRRDDPNQFFYATLLEAVENAQKEAELLDELRSLQEGLFEELVIRHWNTTLAAGAGHQASLVDRIVAGTDGELAVVREYLNETNPSWEQELRDEHDGLLRVELGEDYERLTGTPILFLNEQDQTNLNNARNQIFQIAGRAAVALAVSPREIANAIQGPNRARALDIIQEISDLQEQTRMSELYRGIMNYAFREREVVVEQQDEMILGRQHLFDARAAFRRADYETADRLWLEAMGQWAAIIDKPGFEDLRENPQFVRDAIDLVTRYVIILDQRDAIFPTAHPLQSLLTESLANLGYAGLVTALDYVRARIDAGEDAETVETMLQTLVSRWADMLHSEAYFPLAPLPELRDQILETSALFVETARQLNRQLSPFFPLRDFTALMLHHDPLLTQATSLAMEASATLHTIPRGEQPSEDQLQQVREKMDAAVDIWKTLLQRYPLLYVDNTLPLHIVLTNTVVEYEYILRLQGEELPEDFPLRDFL